MSQLDNDRFIDRLLWLDRQAEHRREMDQRAREREWTDLLLRSALRARPWPWNDKGRPRKDAR